MKKSKNITHRGGPKMIKQKLNMDEHTARLQALPTGGWVPFKRLITLLLGGLGLVGLLWMAWRQL
jgi:hypothetical protein